MKRTLPALALILLLIVLASSCAAAPLGIDVTVTLKPPSLAPGATFQATGRATYPDSLPVAGAAVNVTIEKTVPLVYDNSTVTGADGTYSVTLQAPAVAGTYDINVSVWDGSVAGYGSAILTVLQPLADLCLDSSDISFSPDGPKSGDPTTISATIHNAGKVEGNATVFFYDGYGKGGSQELGNTTVSVPAEGSQLTSLVWMARSGSHNIYVSVANVQPGDSDTTNNLANRTVDVKDVVPPDISDVSRSPPTPDSSEVFNVSARIIDDVGMDKSSPASLNLWVDGAQYLLPPSGSGDDTYWWHVGPYPATSSIVYNVTALDSSANRAWSQEYTFSVAYSKLEVFIPFGRKEVSTNARLPITGSVLFDGDVPADGVVVSMTLLGVQGATWTVESDANGSFSVQIDAPGSEGWYKLVVSVVSGQLSNDTSAILDVVERHPDLFVSSSSISYSIVPDNGTVKLTVMVENHGDAGSPATVKIYDGVDSGGTLLAEEELQIPAGGYKSFTLWWNATPGSNRVFVSVRGDNEEITFNNQAMTVVQVPGSEGDGPAAEPAADYTLPLVAALAISGVVNAVLLLRGRRPKGRKPGISVEIMEVNE